MERIIFLLSSLVLASCQFDPYSPGPYNLSRFNVNHNETLGLPYNLDVWTPNEPGTYPIIFFIDGFGAYTPGDGYDGVSEHISSHGYVMVLTWLLNGNPLVYEDKVPYFNQTVHWCKDNLENFLYYNGITTDLSIEFNLTYGMAHSSGCAIYSEYFALECGDFKGLIFTSPVDTTVNPTIPEEGYVNYSLPTLFMAAGLDSVPGHNTTIACAPEDLSNKHFYDAWPPSAHKWGINATDFGHVDYMDELVRQIIQTTNFCSYNEDATEMDFQTYITFVGGQAVTFIKATLSDGDCAEYVDIMENTDNMPVEATATNYKPTPCPSPQCSLLYQ